MNKLWIPSRRLVEPPAVPLCHRCCRLRRGIDPRRLRISPYWAPLTRLLDSAGDRKLDSDGNRALDSTGARYLASSTESAGDPCCCIDPDCKLAPAFPCASAAWKPSWWLVTLSGVHLEGLCFNGDKTHGSPDGAYCVQGPKAIDPWPSLTWDHYSGVPCSGSVVSSGNSGGGELRVSFSAGPTIDIKFTYAGHVVSRWIESFDQAHCTTSYTYSSNLTVDSFSVSPGGSATLKPCGCPEADI